MMDDAMDRLKGLDDRLEVLNDHLKEINTRLYSIDLAISKIATPLSAKETRKTFLADEKFRHGCLALLANPKSTPKDKDALEGWRKQSYVTEAQVQYYRGIYKRVLGHFPDETAPAKPLEVPPLDNEIPF